MVINDLGPEKISEPSVTQGYGEVYIGLVINDLGPEENSRTIGQVCIGSVINDLGSREKKSI